MSDDANAAKRKFRQFTGRDAKAVGQVDVPTPKCLVYLGEGVAIEYRAAKRNDPRTRGKLSTYRHKLGKAVKIFTDPEGRALFIVGGRFKVTDWMRY